MVVVSMGMPMQEAKREVRLRLDRGESFERVEAFIEEQWELDDEERAVLWLYAWSDCDLQAVTLDLGRPALVG